jgi:hypothetical protein
MNELASLHKDVRNVQIDVTTLKGQIDRIDKILDKWDIVLHCVISLGTAMLFIMCIDWSLRVAH